jgi:hypothetical protein
MNIRDLLGAAALLLLFGSPAWANSLRVSSEDLAKAINRADAAAVPYRTGRLSPRDVRRLRCAGPEEEPTEFDCRWEQRTGRGWLKRSTWVAIDGDHLVVID